MRPTRRDVIFTMSGALAVAVAGKALAGEPAEVQAREPQKNPLPSPNAPNQNVPAGLSGTDIPVVGDKVFAPANWAEVKKTAQQILDLATDFKWQVEHTNLKATLPVLLLHEAHDLEKLAKQVQKRMA